MSAEQKELLKADLAMFKRVNAASRLETPSTKWVYAMRNQVGYAGVGRLPQDLLCKVLVDPTEQALAATALSKRDEITLCETDSQPESIFKLFDSFFRGHTQTEEIDPLYVFKHVDPNGEIGLFSRNNRRLMACLMFQAQQRMCSQNCTRCP